MTDDDGRDARLLERTAAGDRSALETILARYSAAVTRYAWALVGSQADVEEVVQDTFLTCWRTAGAISLPDQSLLPWLLVTCRDLSLNLNRSRRRHEPHQFPDDLLENHADDDARERLRWVLAEIEKLTPTDRRVCEICLIEGRSYADAAHEVGIGAGAVRQRVSRSRDRLRKAVTENED